VGGVGKTRLVLEAAERMRGAFPDGVRFVDFATVTDSTLVPQVVLTALGVSEHSTRPSLAQLVDHLSGRQALIVLDNCEHVVNEVAPLVDGLLRRARDVRVLATSRHVLGVPGERLFALRPLAVPDPAEALQAAMIGEYDAVRLLLDRVEALEPRFALTDANAADVAQLCVQLDGLPLAIELAAIRLRTLTPEQVVRRLARRFALLTGESLIAPPRQQTLRSLVDWSFALCSPGERLLWTRLSVFAGSFDLAAAEGVCADGELPSESIADLLDRMVAQSIVVVEHGGANIRFRLLETIRQYGRERLAEHGQVAAVQRRHRDHYLAVAEQAAQRWCGPTQAADLARLRADYGNLRAAIETALAETGADAPQSALRLVVALRYLWCADGFLADGRRWLDEALALPGPEDALRAQALWVAAWTCLLQGDEQAAVDRLAACEQLGERISDWRSVAYAASLRGTAALFRGELDESARLLETAVDLFDREGGVDGLLWGLFQLAITLSHLGHHDRAAAIYRRSLRISTECGEQLCRSYTLWVWGFDMWRRGDSAGATCSVSQGLEIQRSFHDPLGAALMIELLAWIAADEGQVSVAASRLAAARLLWASIGTSIGAFGPPLRAHHDVCVARVDRDPGSGPESSPASSRAMPLGEILRQVLDGVPAGEGESVADRPAARPAPAEMPSTPPGPDISMLTNRELTVADLVADGLTNRAIAAALVISPRTVDGHMERILAKLGFTSRAQVAAWLAAHRASAPQPTPQQAPHP
jgi:non-specific serine/threonine protein kinase